MKLSSIVFLCAFAAGNASAAAPDAVERRAAQLLAEAGKQQDAYPLRYSEEFALLSITPKEIASDLSVEVYGSDLRGELAVEYLRLRNDSSMAQLDLRSARSRLQAAESARSLGGRDADVYDCEAEAAKDAARADSALIDLAAINLLLRRMNLADYGSNPDEPTRLRVSRGGDPFAGKTGDVMFQVLGTYTNVIGD